MTTSPTARRRMHALAAALSAGLIVASAAPAIAPAAEVEFEGREGSRAAAALAEGSRSVERENDETGEVNAGDRAPAGRSRWEDDGADRGSVGAKDGASRASAALARDDEGRSLEADLDERAAAIRRKVRADGASLRRQLRDGARRERSRDTNDPADGASPGDDAATEATVAVAASDDRVQLLPGNSNILVRRRALVRGYLPSRRAGSDVVLELLSGGRWVTVDTATTIEDGRFYLAWYPSRPGYFRVRVRPASTRSTVEPSGVRLLYVFREVLASWYGPGFYGNRTACGQTFTSRLIGVAHKSLPCGHRLTVRYRGRSRTVTVVDRGPYVDGRTYDLTEALRDYLGFDGVDEILATS